MNKPEPNPIQESIKWLVECGWTKEQAINLCKAIKSNKSPEDLWEVVPKWIEHCGESMKYVHAMLGTVAMGFVDVTLGDDGEWMFQLNDNGIQAGKDMGLK
jgi:hypothetical protein